MNVHKEANERWINFEKGIKLQLRHSFNVEKKIFFNMDHLHKDETWQCHGLVEPSSFGLQVRRVTPQSYDTLKKAKQRRSPKHVK